MSLTAYCEFDEVRSALGVNDIELKDTVLGLPVYEMGLVRELNRLSTSLNAAFSTIQLKDTSTRTTAEATLYDSIRLFSVYAVAKQVGVALANFAPKDIGDGKATISRYAGEPFRAVLENIDQYYQSLRLEVRAAYAAILTSVVIKDSTTPATVFMASKRGYDPVTGV